VGAALRDLEIARAQLSIPSYKFHLLTKLTEGEKG
jgi:hypothetical protein